MLSACAPRCAAPEVLRKKPHTTSCDLWSLCVVLHECLLGGLPSSLQYLLSASARVLLKGLMTVHPGRRFTAAHVLASPFLSSDHDAVICRQGSTSGGVQCVLRSLSENIHGKHLGKAFQNFGLAWGVPKIALGPCECWPSKIFSHTHLAVYQPTEIR